MKTDKPTPGFPHRETSWLFGLIAVRAPLVQVKAVAARANGGEMRESHAFQLTNSEYSMLSWDKCEPGLARWLSEKLKTRATYVWDEDTSGWFGYSIFTKGREDEAFQFGPNYEDELGELAEDLGGSTPKPKRRQERWHTFVSQGGEDFQFRSKLVKVTQKDLLRGLVLVDEPFQSLGIPIPGDFPKHQELILWPFPS